MKRLVLGRRKMSSVLCQSARDASLATRRGSVTVDSVTASGLVRGSASGVPASGVVPGVAPCLGAASAACPPSAAARKPGRSQTSPKSVAMNGLGAGRCSAWLGVRIRVRVRVRVRGRVKVRVKLALTLTLALTLALAQTGWGGSDAQRASAAGSMGVQRWAVPYLLRVRAGARVRP